MKQMKLKYMFHSFRVKVMVAIVLMSIVTSLCVSLVFLHQSTGVLVENYTQALWSRLSSASQILDQSLQNAYDITLFLCYDDELEKMLAEYEAVPAWERSAVQEHRQRISSYLHTACKNALDVENVYIYLSEKKQVLTSDVYNSAREIFVPDFHGWLTNPPSSGSLSPQMVNDRIRRLPENIMSYVRTLENPDGTLSRSIAVNMNSYSLFYHCIDQVRVSEEDAYYVVAPDGCVCFAPAMSDVGLPITSILPEFADMVNDRNQLQVRIGEEGQLIASVTSDMTGYRIVATHAKSDLTQIVNQQRAFILTIAVLITLIALCAAYYLSDHMYQPVRELKQAMAQASDGDFSIRATVYTNDDIGQLADGFNSMVSRIERLIGQLVTERMQKKEAEIEALQYQITPHFMYNTLNSIKFAAYLQGVSNLGDQIGAFVELLQASISRNGAFITLKSEIRLVEDYIKLQNFRYMGRFDVIYHIEEKTNDYFVPRLLLQPLVENAILHGQKKDESTCHITISAHCSGSTLYLTVQDEGDGMTKEQIQGLLSSREKKHSGFSGIGVRNVLERLHLYYGEQASLHYISTSRGTKAVIKLPVSTDAVEYEI